MLWHYNTFHFINIFKWYYNRLEEDNEVTVITAQWKVIYKCQEIHKETVSTQSLTFVRDMTRQSFRSEAVQMTTYLLGQEGNDLCTYSIQPLDNFCLQVTRKKKFNYINSQMRLSPTNPKETFAWFSSTLAHPLAKKYSQNYKSVCTQTQKYLGS